MRIQNFTTSRLSITSWRTIVQGPKQRAALEQDLALILTPNVLAPLPEPLRLPRGAGQIADWVRAREAESDVYSVTHLGTGVLLGLLILAHDGPQNVHLGYMLADAAWGRGYATEVVWGLLEATPKGQGIVYVAGVGVANPASSSVLLKTGFVLSPQMSSLDTRVYTQVVA